jgi:hypothetical protein
MAQGYILTIRDLFNKSAQDQAFDAITADLATMSDARLIAAQRLIGTMVVEVDNDDTLRALQSTYDDRFHFKPEGTMRALKK